MGEAHEAIVAIVQKNRLDKGVSWEVYGDWEEDPSKLRTDVYALVPSGG